MPTYAQTVREHLEEMDDDEIRERLTSGSLTEEARAIALSILNARGVPVEAPPSMPLQDVVAPMQLGEPKLPERSAFLGIGLLATATGFSFLFNSGKSVGYGLGIAVGQLFGASIIALPIFLVWRFFTTNGRTKPVVTAFNVFSAIVLIVWFVTFAVLPLLIPAVLPFR